MIKPTKLPFETTKADPEKSRAEIINLLRKFGIDDYSWSEELGQTRLSFKTDVRINEDIRWYTVILTPALPAKEMWVYDEMKKQKVKKMIPMYAQAYRILLNYLKAKLTNVSLGVVKFEEEFLADIEVRTPEGPKRLIEVVKSRSPGLLGLPEIKSNELRGEHE